MLRQSVYRLVRRKHSQRAWSPNASSSGAAPTTGITAQEALQIAYRPMPPAQTVEYEEDFGSNMIIHRECVVQRNRDRMSFDIAPLAYSDTELHKAQQQLARHMNREREGGALSTGPPQDTAGTSHANGSFSDCVHLNVDVDDETRTVRSARYLFDAARLQYCSRFQNFFHDYVEGEEHRGHADDPQSKGEEEAIDGGGRAKPSSHTGGSSSRGHGEDTHILFSLMEACAILYGCSTPVAQETYYRTFLNLDLDSLEDDEAKQRDLIADACTVQDELSAARHTRTMSGNRLHGGMQGGEGQQSVTSLMDSIPCLFDHDDGDDDGHGNENSARRDTTHGAKLSGCGTSASRVHRTTDQRLESKSQGRDQGRSDGDDAVPNPSLGHESNVGVVLEDCELSPLYKAYMAHSKGDSPVASYDLSSIGSVADLSERRRWRSIMERLVREEYHTFTRADWHEAAALNSQLHTVKFYDLKVGDTVREILHLMQRESGHGSSVHRDTPLRTSPTHPQNRAANTTTTVH